jgi:hypothetical protein
MMEDTHSYRLSPLGPAEQLVGGSNEISASSFWMRFAAELIEPPFDMVASGQRLLFERGSRARGRARGTGACVAGRTSL